MSFSLQDQHPSPVPWLACTDSSGKAHKGHDRRSPAPGMAPIRAAQDTLPCEHLSTSDRAAPSSPEPSQLTPPKSWGAWCWESRWWTPSFSPSRLQASQGLFWDTSHFVLGPWATCFAAELPSPHEFHSYGISPAAPLPPLLYCLAPGKWVCLPGRSGSRTCPPQ